MQVPRTTESGNSNNSVDADGRDAGDAVTVTVQRFYLLTIQVIYTLQTTTDGYFTNEGVVYV